MNESSVSLAAHRSRALRETVLMAASSAMSFLLSLARTKVLAVAWGPVGMGAMGMMQAAMSTATVLTGGGIDGIVTRELAKTHGSDPARAAAVASAASRGVAVLSFFGGVLSFLVLVLLRQELGLGSLPTLALIAVGVAASIISANLRASLAAVGLLRVLASVGVGAALLALVFSLGLSVLPSGDAVLALAVLLVPFSQLAAAAVAYRRMPDFPRLPWLASVRQTGSLARMASFLAIAGVLPPLAQLIMRSLVREKLSPELFGCFQASMVLAATSVSVLASSVGPSVLPRLSAAAGDAVRISEVVNEQSMIYLTLFAPVALGLVALPELVVRLLFSPAFAPVADQLSWQMVGEVLRLPCWVLATTLTAQSRTRAYLLVEAVTLASLVSGTALASTTGSLTALGLAVSGSTLLQFALLLLLLRGDRIVLTRALAIRLGLLICSVAVGACWAREFMAVRILVVGAAGWASWNAVQAMMKMRASKPAIDSPRS